MRAPRGHAEHIHLLVAPVKWTTTVAVKNIFEEEELPVRVVGASTTDAALKQLTKHTRYQAVLIDWAESGPAGLELACAIKELGRPLVVAFQEHWSRDDVRRALQLGVDCLLLKPLRPEELLADLQALEEGQASRSRERILKEGGPELLEPDPSLWQDQGDDWRDRMMGLADKLVRPWSEDVEDHASHLEVSVRRKGSMAGISPRMAKAILDVVSQGRARIPEIATARQIEPRELTRVMSAVELFAKKQGGQSRIPLLMDAVLKREKGLDDRTSTKLLSLQRIARVVIRSQGARGKRRDAFNAVISKVTGVPIPVLSQFVRHERYTLSVRLLLAQDEKEALDQVRFLVLSLITTQLAKGRSDQRYLEALQAILGFNPRYEGLDPKELVRRLATLNPIPVLYDLNLPDLMGFMPDLESLPPMEGKPLGDAIEQLVDVARVMGPIDQKRLRDLAYAIPNEAPVLIGKPAWISFHNALNQTLEAPFDQIMDRLLFLLSARTSRGRDHLTSAIGQLVEVGRNAMDAARFAEFCRQAASEPLSADVIAAYAEETYDDFTPDKVERSGASDERARVEEALARFEGLGIDLERVKNTLPPMPKSIQGLSQRGMMEIRVLAAVLDAVPASDRGRIIKHFMGQYLFHPQEVEALELMLGNSSLIDQLKSGFIAKKPEQIRPGIDAADEIEVEAPIAFDDGFNLDDEPDLPELNETHLMAAPDEAGTGAFELGPTYPEPEYELPTRSFDLGLDELELELDLEGGSLNANPDSLDLEGLDTDSLDMSGPGFEDSIFNRSGDERSQWSRDEAPRRSSAPPAAPLSPGFAGSWERGMEDASRNDRRTKNMSSGRLDNGRGSGDRDSTGWSTGFDLGGGRQARPTSRISNDTLSDDFDPDAQFSLALVQRLVSSSRLRQAAQLCLQSADDTPELCAGLNLVALHAYEAEHHTAAGRLWERAMRLDGNRINVIFNFARLLVDSGRFTEAEPLIEKLLQLKPHLSPAMELKKRLEGGDHG